LFSAIDVSASAGNASPSHIEHSLRLPLDLKLILGLELAHAQNSPFLLDVNEPNGATKTYMGGLAVNF
jgi:hypothetical protein